MAEHREQEIFGALELAQLARRHQPGVDELGHGAYAVDELADPEERVKVAEPPLPLLHIGRSEEHTSETPVTNAHLVCRLLLEKKKKTISHSRYSTIPQALPTIYCQSYS